MMGVRFTGHPDLKRILMWDGFGPLPLRKDFLEPYYEGPTKAFDSRWSRTASTSAPRRSTPTARTSSIPTASTAKAATPRGRRHLRAGRSMSDGGVEISELDTDQFIVSMGPQHPSTHGVFRMNLRVDGETIVGAQAGDGLHAPQPREDRRAEHVPDELPVHRPARLPDSMGNNFGYALAVEQLMGDDAKPPERAEYIRVIMAELTRIASHMWSIGFLLNDLGAFFTPALYAIEERELILDLFEWAAGSRMMCNYFRFGGVAFDLPDGLDRALPTGSSTTGSTRKIDELDRYLTGNEIVARPLQGRRRPDRPSRRSTSRPPARCCGPRASPTTSAAPRPTASTTASTSNVIMRHNGDVYDRYLVRLEEMRESVKILKQALRDLPGGPILPGKKSTRSRCRPARRTRGSRTPRASWATTSSPTAAATAYRYHVRAPELHQPDALRADVHGPHDRRRGRHPGQPRHRAGRDRPVMADARHFGA